jgi:hypothetical protein
VGDHALAALSIGERSQVPIEEKAGGTTKVVGTFWKGEKYLSLLRIELQIV